jgi:hypothetical protein
MIFNTEIFGFSLAEVVVLFAALAFTVKTGMEMLGHAPSVNLLRVENADLVRRNTELESETIRLEKRVKELETHVTELTAKVSELQKNDLESVVKKIDTHEHDATKRHLQIIELLNPRLYGKEEPV